MKPSSVFMLVLLFLLCHAGEGSQKEEPHPNPNDEDYVGMTYIGRIGADGRRIGFDTDNG